MMRLLKIELHKLRYNRSVKVISIVYFVLITFIAFIASIEFNFGDFNFRVADQGIFNFPFIWHFNTYIAAILKLFLAIVIVSMISNEYSYRTLKQNLIDGLNKKEFILSKFLTVLLFAVASTFFIFVVSLILGLTFSDYNEIGIIFSDLEYIGAYFLKLTVFFSFCLFLGVMVKRSSFALGFLIVLQFIVWLSYIVMILRVFKYTDITESVAQFFPLASMSNLIREPFSHLGVVQTAPTQLGESFSKAYGVGILNVLIVLFWTCIFIYGSYVILKKRDL